MNYLDWYYSISQAHTPSRPVVWNVVHGKSEVERRGKKDKESEREAKRKGQEGKRETETERQREREGQREAKDRTRTWEKERGSDSHLTEKGRALFLFHMLWSQKRYLLSFRSRGFEGCVQGAASECWAIHTWAKTEPTPGYFSTVRDIFSSLSCRDGISENIA